MIGDVAAGGLTGSAFLRGALPRSGSASIAGSRVSPGWRSDRRGPSAGGRPLPGCQAPGLVETGLEVAQIGQDHGQRAGRLSHR
jgi:hypothetical protein